MAKSNQKKKKNVKVEAMGEAHIQATFNNVIISLTNNAALFKVFTGGKGRSSVIN